MLVSRRVNNNKTESKFGNRAFLLAEILAQPFVVLPTLHSFLFFLKGKLAPSQKGNQGQNRIFALSRSQK